MERKAMTELDESRAAVLDCMADSASICNGCDACRDARELLSAFERAVRRDEGKETCAEILRRCNPPIEVMDAISHREHLTEAEA